MKLSFFRNREVKNAGWLISGKVVQMVLSLVVGIWTARYLGPGDYGTINYGNSFISFFMSFCTLGINSVIVKEFADSPQKAGETLGTAITLRILSSFLSAVLIIGIVAFIDFDEPMTIVVVALCSISLLFHVFDTFNYWFQYHYKSHVTAIATLLAYIGTAVYRIVLLSTGKSLLWFAMAMSVDYIVLGLVLYVAYKRQNGPPLSFSWATGKQLLGKSYHYILSGMMVAIYVQTDKLMLKQLLGEVSVGYYTVGTTVCGMWVFVLAAIIDAVYPTIIRLHKESKAAFETKNRQLYAIVFYLSVIVSLVFLLLGDKLILFMYGEEYRASINVLKIATWYTTFSYLGVARSAWIVCENQQKYLKYTSMGAAITNVLLNALLIPIWGIEGAAIASLVSQSFTSLVLPFMLKPLRPNAKLMLEAIILKNIR